MFDKNSASAAQRSVELSVHLSPVSVVNVSVGSKQTLTMNQYGVDEQFSCREGCESANQCEYYNNLPASQVIPQLQNYVDHGNFYYGCNFEDGVVPSGQYEASNHQQVQCFPNYPDPSAVQPTSGFYDQSVSQNVGFAGGNYFLESAQTYPPCQGPQPWNYAQCFGYYGEAPCQFSNVVDMEDFM
jgi:hypothetical protein